MFVFTLDVRVAAGAIDNQETQEAGVKGRTPAATALAIGYLLGRRRKLRTATFMAVATAIGGSSMGSLIMRQGMKKLGGTQALAKLSPQLGDIAETVRGDLLTAGKAAATAAVSSKVDALTDSIHERAERVRNGVDVAAEGAGEAAAEGSRAARSGGRAAAGASRRAAAGAGGTARRMTGRGATEPDDSDDYPDEDYAADESAGYDDVEDRDAVDDDMDDVDDDRGDMADTVPRRGDTARRRSPVTRTRR